MIYLFIHFIVFNLSAFYLSLMVFQRSLGGSKSQVSRILHSILPVLNNAIVWMVSTRPTASKSSSPFNNPLLTVPKAPITIGIIVTFMFQSLFSSLVRSRYLSFFSLSFSFIQQSPQFCKFSFFIDHYKVWSSGRD